MFEKSKKFLFRNTNTKQTVAKNTVWLSISNFGGRILKAVIIIYAARVLGTAQYGVLSYALTLTAFLTLFIDPGINAILVRDASRGTPEEKRAIFSTTLFIKIVLLAAGALIVLFIGPSFSTLPGAKILLPAAAVIIVCDSIREFLSAYIRTRERMEQEAAIFMTTNAAIVILGFIALRMSPTPLFLIWAYAGGTAVGMVTAVVTFRDQLKNLGSFFSKRLIGPIFRSAWPFAITGALGAMLTGCDILIISWMKTASDVGMYAAAIRIIQVLYLVPTIIQFSILPLLARLARRDDKKFATAMERIVGTVFLASIPLALGGVIVGTQVMTLVYGSAYAAGGLPFKILMLTMLIDFPATIISTAIFAYDRQKSLIITSLVAGIPNVVLDLILIPRFGMAGSAVATLIAQFLGNWYLWRTLKKINQFKVLPHLKKAALAGIVMAVTTTILLISGTNVIANVLISGAVYIGMLIALHEPLLFEIGAIIAPERLIAPTDSP